MLALPVFSFCSVSFSSLLRGLAPSVVFPFVYHQHLPLSVGSLNSGWPGTTAVHSYFPSVLINIIHPHSQNCLVWVKNYLVLLFISDLDLQPCKYSNTPILKYATDTHFPNPMPYPIFLCLFLHSHTYWNYRSDLLSQFPSLSESSRPMVSKPFWHQELALWKAFFS